MTAETTRPTPTDIKTGRIGIIDRVPTAQELKAMYDHPVYGEVSQFQKDIDAFSAWGIDKVGDKNILTRLRDEIIFAGAQPELGRSMYDVADYIAKAELASIDHEKRARVSRLLSDSRFYARPHSYVHVEAQGETAGTHSRRRHELGLEQNSLDETAKELRHMAETNGFEWHDPKDAYLVVFMRVGAHEAGHAVLAGVSELGHQVIPEGRNENLQASYDYIRRHPEMSLTGNLEHDVATQEERFAEGYGQFVVDRALQTLGYTPEETQFLNRFLQPFDVSDISQGELGYHNPLTAQQLVDELFELESMIATKTFGRGFTNPHAWGETVQLGRDQAAQHAEMGRTDLLDGDFGAGDGFA